MTFMWEMWTDLSVALIQLNFHNKPLKWFYVKRQENMLQMINYEICLSHQNYFCLQQDLKLSFSYKILCFTKLILKVS